VCVGGGGRGGEGGRREKKANVIKRSNNYQSGDDLLHEEAGTSPLDKSTPGTGSLDKNNNVDQTGKKCYK